MHEDQIIGCILGTALGDALGLPYEGLSRQRSERLLGPPDRFRLLPGLGMISDDTEHTCLTARALIESRRNPEEFRRRLPGKFRWWFAGLPPGTGLATARACLKLWLGVPPERSGVFSAGNGPAMRAAIVGAAVSDLELLRELVHINTWITHTDPKAEFGALAVALAAHQIVWHGSHAPEQYRELLHRQLPGEAEEFLLLMEAVFESVRREETPVQFAVSRGWNQRVTGYVYQTVPVALHAWLRYPKDYHSGVQAAIGCGGDADSVAAITGGLIGCQVGLTGLPGDWLRQLRDWPMTRGWQEELGRVLARSLTEISVSRPPRLRFRALLPLRNLCLLAVVLGHGFRRLFPPY